MIKCKCGSKAMIQSQYCERKVVLIMCMKCHRYEVAKTKKECLQRWNEENQ